MHDACRTGNTFSHAQSYTVQRIVAKHSKTFPQIFIISSIWEERIDVGWIFHNRLGFTLTWMVLSQIPPLVCMSCALHSLSFVWAASTKSGGHALAHASHAFVLLSNSISRYHIFGPHAQSLGKVSSWVELISSWLLTIHVFSTKSGGLDTGLHNSHVSHAFVI